jgi:hypothetical protein
VTDESTRPCEHWIGSDATGRKCGVATTGSFPFCEKHLPIQRARAEKFLAKQRQQEKRAEDAWRARNVPRLPQMRVQLERAKSEYARRTRSAVDDRAAVGGNTHRAVSRAQQRVLSDSNVSRVVELERLVSRLRGDISRAERQP